MATIEQLQKTMHAEDITLAISVGLLDDNLRDLERAIDARRQRVGASFKVGEEVKLNDTVRPRYLVGVVGTVVRVNQKRVVVLFQQANNPGRDLGKYVGEITVPFDMLEQR